jgi:hypothetical protein
VAINVIQPSAFGPEQIVAAATLIGRSKDRAAVFKAVYTGKSPTKTVAELMNTLKRPRTKVLDAGKRLADGDVIDPVKVDGLTAYRKIASYQHHRDKILRLAKSKSARDKVPTVRNPAQSGGSQKSLTSIKLNVKVPKAKVRAERITIDEIASFAKVKKFSRNQPYTKISETNFKDGVAAVLGLRHKFKDWGGELRDLYDTGLTINGKRYAVAFAFKGPGMTGTLVPGKMGKNGDQIQRLLKCPADVFLVQYWRDIADSVMDQLQQLAELLSYQRDQRIYYGQIDGIDSTRLIKAYPAKFKVTHGRRER